MVRRGGSGCDNLLSTGAGQDAAGRHLLQQKGLSQAAAAARAHRGYMHWVHGQMMIVAFVGLVPLGVWMAYARRTLPSATWFQAHRAVQVRPSACRKCFGRIGSTLGRECRTLAMLQCLLGNNVVTCSNR